MSHHVFFSKNKKHKLPEYVERLIFIASSLTVHKSFVVNKCAMCLRRKSINDFLVGSSARAQAATNSKLEYCYSPMRCLYLENPPSTVSARASQRRWAFEVRAYHRLRFCRPESALISSHECVTDSSSWKRPIKRFIIHEGNCAICYGQSGMISNHAYHFPLFDGLLRAQSVVQHLRQFLPIFLVLRFTCERSQEEETRNEKKTSQNVKRQHISNT